MIIMKKIILFALLTLSPSVLFGQKAYKPFLEEGKIWTYRYLNYMSETYDISSLTVMGDTLIGQQSYKKIIDLATGSCDYVMREDGSKVYYKYRDKNEYLLYDFGLAVGDDFSTLDVKATVVAEDTIVVGGRSFRAVDVRADDDNMHPNWWVEGIGSMYHLTTSFLCPGNYHTFLQCQLGEEILFTQEAFRTLSVHGVTVDSNKSFTSPIFDLQGRRLNGQPQNGIYIKDRKKYVK